MKKEIPEIDTLLDGINDPDAVLDPSPTKEKTPNDILLGCSVLCSKINSHY